MHYWLFFSDSAGFGLLDEVLVNIMLLEEVVELVEGHGLHEDLLHAALITLVNQLLGWIASC